MHKYPIGLQDFSKLIEGGFIYVDKTMYLHKMLNEAGIFFLSRTHRFGKSLLISTIDELFKEIKKYLKIHIFMINGIGINQIQLSEFHLAI
jgi:hypothetical protein